jgi:hypothetical protein
MVGEAVLPLFRGLIHWLQKSWSSSSCCTWIHSGLAPPPKERRNYVATRATQASGALAAEAATTASGDKVL